MITVTAGTSEALAALTKPWADYHGDLPDFDHPLRCVFEAGVQYTVELLAKELKVTDYTPCDGTEEYDGDLGGTLMNIVLAAMPKDEFGDPVYPRDLAAVVPLAPLLREALERFRARSEEVVRLASRDRILSDSVVTGFRLADAQAVLAALASIDPA